MSNNLYKKIDKNEHNEIKRNGKMIKEGIKLLSFFSTLIAIVIKSIDESKDDVKNK